MTLPAQPELADAWREIRAALRRTVGDPTFELWLEPLELREGNSQVLVLTAPASTRTWIAERYGRILELCALDVLGTEVRVDVVAAEGRAGRRGTSHAKPLEPTLEPEAGTSFNPRHSFDQFVIGDGNRLAHAASLAAAELPGQAYNPLFLQAPPGLGKTHLLHAIGNYILAFGGGTTVRYTTVESFTNHFINALSSRSLNTFKQAYRGVDVLLIDDVQFLASKAKTEEEFFHTFNSLYEAGRQLVITCDRLPRELVSVQERLRERFESGLVAEIQPPDFATRLTILHKRAALDRIPLADHTVLDLIAERVVGNVRTLEGALIRVVAYHSLTRRPIDAALTTTVLDTMYPKTRAGTPSVADVQQAVADHFQITLAQLTSPTRAARVAWPRQIAMHLARELTHAPLSAIGSAFGGRNHATIHYACARVSDRMRSDQTVAQTLTELTAAISSDRLDRGS